MATNKILNREDIELLCSFINKLANISEGIDDINLKTDGTFSSVKIDNLLKQLKEENKDYTDEQILKVKNTTIKVIDNLDKAIDEGIIYLYKSPDSNVYSRYLIIDGTLTPLDNITINLDNIYTKEETNKLIKDITDDLGSAELTTTAKTIKEAINELKTSLNNKEENTGDKDDNTHFKEITQDEYNALTNKKDNIIYYITDKKLIILNEITYSNNINKEDLIDIITDFDDIVTNEQLVGAKYLKDIIGSESLTTTALTLKGAINELKTLIDDLDKDEDDNKDEDGTNKELHQELTKAEYDVLTDEEKTNGIIRFITDKNYIIVNNIEYGKSNENTSSGGEVTGDGIAIYENYSGFPKTINKDTIVFAKNDWTDAYDGEYYVKGFYFANKETNTYKSLLQTISEIPVASWDGVTKKPFEYLSQDFIVDGDMLKINPEIHDSINTELTAIKSALEKAATIDDTSTSSTDTWSAEKILSELEKKGSKELEHEHDNLEVLDNFDENPNGLPVYNSSILMTTNIYDVDNDGIVDKAKEAEKLKDVTATTTEINYLSGAKSNIQKQIDSISSGMLFKGEYKTFAQMFSALTEPKQGWFVYIVEDEKTNEKNTQYVYDGTEWVYGGGRSIVNEASATTKGTIQLTGDLTGEASSPQLIEVTTAQTVSYIKGMEIDKKGRVLSITEDKTLAERIAKLEARPQIYVSIEEPEKMINGDIWIQV